MRFTATLALAFVLGMMAQFPSPAKESKPTCELVNDSAYFDRLLADVNKADKSIDAIIYMFLVDLDRKKDIVRDFCDALISAKKRGIPVTVVVDQGQKAGSNKSPKSIDAVTYLKKAGITISYESKKVISHAKAIVIDGKISYIGSANWTYSAWRRNHEVNVRLDDPTLAHQLLNYIREISKESD